MRSRRSSRSWAAPTWTDGRRAAPARRLVLRAFRDWATGVVVRRVAAAHYVRPVVRDAATSSAGPGGPRDLGRNDLPGLRLGDRHPARRADERPGRPTSSSSGRGAPTTSGLVRRHVLVGRGPRGVGASPPRAAEGLRQLCVSALICARRPAPRHRPGHHAGGHARPVPHADHRLAEVRGERQLVEPVGQVQGRGEPNLPLDRSRRRGARLLAATDVRPQPADLAQADPDQCHGEIPSQTEPSIAVPADAPPDAPGRSRWRRGGSRPRRPRDGPGRSPARALERGGQDHLVAPAGRRPTWTRRWPRRGAAM